MALAIATKQEDVYTLENERPRLVEGKTLLIKIELVAAAWNAVSL